jgi:hypothetical protein
MMIPVPAQRGDAQSWFQFSPDCAQVWAFLDTVAQVPDDRAAFTSRYGDFGNTGDVTKLLTAIADIRRVATAFGSPASVKAALAADPGLLSGNTPPAEVYANLVWLSMQAQTTAGTLNETLSSLGPLLEPSSGDAAERARSLDQLFNGKDGLVESARSCAGQISAFRKKLAQFPTRLQSDVQAVASTSLANDANQEIGGLQTALEREAGQLAEMQEKAAGWNPIGRPTPDAIAELQNDIEAKKRSLAARQQYTADLSDFFPLANNCILALLDIDSRLALLEDALNTVASDLADITRISGKDQLSDIAWLSKALGLPGRVALWKAAVTASQQFQQNSLISNS